MRRPAIFVLLAGVAAMIAAMVVYSALRRREAQVRQAMAQSVNIVVAAHDLSIGTPLDAGSLRSVRWSRDSLPPGAITDPSSVIGQITRTGFVQNEPIVADRLFNGDKNAGILPLLIPSGMRAMSVPVDEVSDISGFVLPHTRVDVLVSLSEGEKTLSRIVLQNVEILAVAQDIEKVNDQPQPVRVVTVLVTPEEAERLTLASREGTLRLAMRNYTDKQIVSTDGIDLTQMMGENPPPAPIVEQRRPVFIAPPPHVQPVEVEILRDGKTSESISFVHGHASSRSNGSAAPSAAPASAAGSPNTIGAPDTSTSGAAAPLSGAASPDVGSPDGGSVPGAGMNITAPMGAMSAATALSKTEGMVGAATPPAVLLPPASNRASLPAADNVGDSYGGPRSHTIDVP